jgi:uncharacterized protein (TIGR02687 family)
MKTDQLNDGLARAFFTEQHRIVFWYDPEQEFTADLADLDLPDVTLLNMQQESELAVKIRLENEDTSEKFLLYFPWSEPPVDKDWLLDIKLYSRSFFADRYSILFNELGLKRRAMREHLVQREAFLASKSRVAALQKYIEPDADEAAIDLAMMSATVRADIGDLPHILFALGQQASDQNTGLEADPPALTDFAKYKLMGSFAACLQTEIGYPASATQLTGSEPIKFGNILIRLLTTGFCESIKITPDWAKPHILETTRAQASSRALLSRWRDSNRYYTAFDQISAWVSEALGIENRLESIALNDLVQVATFEAAEQQIIRVIAEGVPTADIHELEHLAELIQLRRDGYWASKHHDDEKRRAYRTLYNALSASIGLFQLRQRHPDGFFYPNISEFYTAYEQELHLFDLHYRHYWYASRSTNAEVLKPLDQAVESCYSNGYIAHLAQSWGDLLAQEQKLHQWALPSVPRQQDFFADRVMPLLTKSTQQPRRVVVIISDAFRYEAATELTDRINQKRYSQASLSSQLGVVPSYTTLGMASLLPHESLRYAPDGSDDVLVDGLSSKGTAARSKILAQHGGKAFTAEEVQGWSKEQGREALKDTYLIYVYHNTVDAIGDDAATEADTFDAVQRASDELLALAQKVITQLNSSSLFITADHGFLFQQSKLEDADRSSITDKPDNTIKSKKRYVLGQQLPASSEVWSGNTKDTAGTVCDTQFWIPKGANRFHFVGGARFVHGGAMPQEIIVPVITVNQLRGERARSRTRTKVGVISASSNLRMTNNIANFEFLQTDAVDDSHLPITTAIGIFFEENLVSSEETLTFESTSQQHGDRIKQISLSLAGAEFDRSTDYFIVIRDKDLGTELNRYRVKIDLAFTDDFF